MPISGPVVHQHLMDSLNRYQQRYNADREQLMGTQKTRDAIDASRGDALVDLAKFYLPELTPQAIAGTWVEVRSRIASILQRQDAEVDAAQRELEKEVAHRQSLDEQLVAINRDLDDAIELQRSMTETCETRLRSDERFIELSDSAAKAEAALERAEENLAEIEQDAARKLPAYQESKLFQYLLERNFGTPQYKHRGFTRRMDRSLAKFIGYQEAIRGYQFLTETPDRMRQIIAEDRESLATVMSELERRRDEAADEVGLSAQIQLVGKQIRRRSEVVTASESSMAKVDQIRQQLNHLQDTRGPHYHEAITLFRNMLEGFETDDLQRRAARTVDITDDQIVARIEGAEDKIEDLDQAAQQRRRTLARRQELLSELGQVIQRFRAAGFDSGRSQFVGSFDVLGSLDAAMRDGETDPSAMERLWNSIRSSQRWGPTAMDQITNVATHPMTQVLLNAMAHAAGAALQNAARNAGHRRGHRGPFSTRRRRGSTWGPWGDSSW